MGEEYTKDLDMDDFLFEGIEDLENYNDHAAAAPFSPTIQYPTIVQQQYNDLTEPMLLQSVQQSELTLPLEEKTTFTNQLGQSQSNSFLDLQLLQYSDANPEGFLLFMDPAIVAPPEPAPQPPQPIPEVIIRPPTPPIAVPPRKKPGRKPKPGGRVKKVKKRKLYEDYNEANPEGNSKKVTDAYNAHVNREKQKTLIEQLRMELEGSRAENDLLKSQLEDERKKSEGYLAKLSQLEMPIQSGENAIILPPLTAMHHNDTANIDEDDNLFPMSFSTSLADVEENLFVADFI